MIGTLDQRRGYLMSENQEVYTYRSGEKVFLKKQPDQFVVQALPDELEEKIGISDAKQVSSAASRVTVSTNDLEPLMSKSRTIAPTHHAYYIGNTESEFLITDRVFVTFNKPLSSQEVAAVAGKYGLFILKVYSDLDYLLQLTDQTGMNPVKLIVKLTEDEPQVKIADHVLTHRMNKYQIDLPTDESYANQWHLHTRLQDSEFDPRSSTRCEEAWELLGNYGSPDVVVGLTDDGCKMNHLDFNSEEKFAGWGYFENSRLVTHLDIDADPEKMYEPYNNHGTSCAGVIAAEVDSELTVGSAPECRLLPIKWESDGPYLFIEDDTLSDVLTYIADKVDVLSNSWGLSPVKMWPFRITQQIAELARSGGRRGLGIVFLWAAGNENCPIQHTATVNVPYTNGWRQGFRPNDPPVWQGVRTSLEFQHNLIEVEGVLHVAALASTAQRSHYSNYGTGISICAPSSNSHEYGRIVPLAGQKLGITTTTGPSRNDQRSVITNHFGGTSSATPLVAGITALTISANPNLTALEVISILKRTASRDLNFEGYPKTPPAVYDVDTSWDVSPIAPFDKGDFINIDDSDGTWSPWFGFGRIDAAVAVAEALKLNS